MWAHRNAASFFNFYARLHPEFDSSEQFEKRSKLAIEIENDLFSNIKSDGLEESTKNK